ncbi:hypothetical protein T310_6762 [Rasamsonia emersonii CBS 393.64]|uniref:Uncharacterized protein n=1 Tax=Rasamsonia emersonii (strain ATCC 16479 / CBS 393.64 / IMI 116815) TaxID=1408163 RepID=A0A0F4YM17_RASE3|nr:hypothetical protein T310_6762 [Rasamsonia emersonii CBS 393.64]KKA19274.1 hypothetical protein T310_6762 [Rasamsonia emersonii CBS 393.64]
MWSWACIKVLPSYILAGRHLAKFVLILGRSNTTADSEKKTSILKPLWIPSNVSLYDNPAILPEFRVNDKIVRSITTATTETRSKLPAYSWFIRYYVACRSSSSRSRTDVLRTPRVDYGELESVPDPTTEWLLASTDLV